MRPRSNLKTSYHYALPDQPAEIVFGDRTRDTIARLLGAFGLPGRAFAVNLREDRDAG